MIIRSPCVRCAAVLLLLAADAMGQPAPGRLLVTVVDQTNAVIPNATVTVTNADAAAPQAAVSAQTSGQGVATIGDLAPARYVIRAEFPAFEPGILRDIRVRAGDNRHVIVLHIQKMEDSVNVERDRQTAASDRRNATFGSALTREQIDALSDDPEEMQRQLQEMAGPGAVIRVDSFEGAQLPPKAMIKSIHITRDAFAAENHNAGGVFVDIITQPGQGPFRMGINTRLRDGRLSGRSPFTAVKGPEQTQDYNINFGAPIRRQKSSFNVGVQGLTSYESPNLNVALPGTARAEALGQRMRRERFAVSSNFDYALTRDQTLRISYQPVFDRSRNLGIGAYDLPERAFTREERNHNLRIQEAGPLGRRFFTNTRLALLFGSTESRSNLEAPTIHVNDAFTSGGQQAAGGRRQWGGTLASDLDYVRGIHSVRTGVNVEFHRYHSDSTSNYLGTYTFESLEAYEAGRPTTFTRRIGNPTIDYFHTQAAVYVQDDIRVSRTLTLSPGVRYEVQTHLADANNIGPRFGMTWAPFKGGKTTFRGSAGLFYDWLNTNTYEQTLRVDGFRQRELNILDPSFPDPGDVGIVPPVNRYLLGPDLRMAPTFRMSTGADHAFTRAFRVSVLYAHLRGTGLLRGSNLNAPVDGIRPDPRFSNIIEVASDAQSRQHTLTTSVNLGTPSPPIMNGSGPRFNLRRVAMFGSYTLGSIRNDTDGDFSVAPGALEDEWGPAAFDVRHRASLGINSQAVRNLTINVNLQASSAPPYTIRTGRDDNGDLLFNDRPAGIGRNSARSAGQFAVNSAFVYTFAFGKSSAPGPNGIMVMIPGPGDAPRVTQFTAPPARFRLQLIAQVQNLTNHRNYGGYSGTLGSRFFGQPTLVTNPRKVDFGVSFLF